MWSITQLPSQTKATPPINRTSQIREERLVSEARRLCLIRKANGMPSPKTWMW